MVHRSTAGVGIGAGGVGLLAAEGIQQAAERAVISQRTADLAALGTAGVALWGAIANELGYVSIGTGASAGLAGFGLGTLAWYGGRRAGVAPRLVATVPQEVNLTGPLISAAVFTTVGAGAVTAVGLLR